MAVLAPDPRLEEKALAIAFEEIESRKSLGDRGAKGWAEITVSENGPWGNYCKYPDGSVWNEVGRVPPSFYSCHSRSRGRMRVRLGRNTADSEGSGTKYLTPGKDYYCVSIEYDTVRVVNDDGGPILIHIRHMEIVARDIPSCWELELMDEDGCVILSPPEFVPGFFEHFFGSGDETATANARRVFAEVMSKIAESANDADRSSIEDLLRRVRR